MFFVDEISIIKMYCKPNLDRDGVIDAMNNSLPFTEEVEIQEVVKSAVRKLSVMSQKEFEAIDFSEALDADDVPLWEQ